MRMKRTQMRKMLNMNKKDYENDDGEKENEEVMKGGGGDLNVGGEIEIEA
jgi:hypothetical protein